MPIHDLTRKVVLLTGIGCVGDGWGNGLTIATLFARQGATVFGCDINVEAANKSAEIIRNDEEVLRSRKAAGRDGEEKAGVVEVMQEPIVRLPMYSTGDWSFAGRMLNVASTSDERWLR